MLCTLYEEQENWGTAKCIDEIAHLLHILYAFWPQLEVIITIYFSYEKVAVIINRHVIMLLLLVLVVALLNVLHLTVFFTRLIGTAIPLCHF